jgi:hypothetical protein
LAEGAGVGAAVAGLEADGGVALEADARRERPGIAVDLVAEFAREREE